MASNGTPAGFSASNSKFIGNSSEGMSYCARGGVVGQLKRRTKSRQVKEIDASRIKEMKNFYAAAKQSKIYD